MFRAASYSSVVFMLAVCHLPTGRYHRLAQDASHSRGVLNGSTIRRRAKHAPYLDGGRRLARRSRGRTAVSKSAEVGIVIAIIVVASISVVGYLTYMSSRCSGYPPGGNCPGTYSYAFKTDINYSGGWKQIQYMYHSVGKPSAGTANYTGGTVLGSGPSTGSLTLTGPNNQGLTLCIIAEKLDSSNATLVFSIDSMTNETSLPYGHTTVCEAVVP
jgi:hypothetical protein